MLGKASCGPVERYGVTGGEEAGNGSRRKPVPYGAIDGIVIGSWPVIGARPSNARAAARCENGDALHASRNTGVAGRSCARYGFANEISTTFCPAFCSPPINSGSPPVAAMVAVLELAPKYDDTITTSAPSAACSALSTIAGRRRGVGLATYAPVPPDAAPAVASKTISGLSLIHISEPTRQAEISY